MFFMGRAREGAVLDTKEEDPAPGADFSDFPKNSKTQVSPTSAKGLPLLYMRAAALQMPPELFAREAGNKTHHALAGGATGGPWCVLFRGSRAKSSGGI